jgi:hypothetical protein
MLSTLGWTIGRMKGAFSKKVGALAKGRVVVAVALPKRRLRTVAQSETGHAADDNRKPGPEATREALARVVDRPAGGRLMPGRRFFGPESQD